MPQGSVSIVIPAYNEESRILRTLRHVIQYIEKHDFSAEIIVVNDGSTDATSDVAASATSDACPISIIELPQNQGKGAAVKAGVLAAEKDFILFCDADGSTPIAEFSKLLQQMPQYDIAIGSRALYEKGCTVRTVWYRKFIGRCFHLLVSCFAVSGIKDTQCGFKLFKKEIAKPLFMQLTCSGFAFDVELLLRAKKEGYKVVEVPVNWVNVEGSKVNLLLDPLKMFRDILLIRFRLMRGA